MQPVSAGYNIALVGMRVVCVRVHERARLFWYMNWKYFNCCMWLKCMSMRNAKYSMFQCAINDLVEMPPKWDGYRFESSAPEG